MAQVPQSTLRIDTGATKLLGLREELLKEALRAGHTRAHARALAGVTSRDFQLWMSRGGVGHPAKRCPPDIQWEPYFGFAQRVIEAEEEGRRITIPPAYLKYHHPTFPTPVQQAFFLQALREGHGLQAAAGRSGIDPDRLWSVLRRGGYPGLDHIYPSMTPEDVEEPYSSFVKDVQRAEEWYFTGSPEGRETGGLGS